MTSSTPFTEAHNNISNFDDLTGLIVIAGQNGVSDTAGVNTRDFIQMLRRASASPMT